MDSFMKNMLRVLMGVILAGALMAPTEGRLFSLTGLAPVTSHTDVLVILVFLLFLYGLIGHAVLADERMESGRQWSWGMYSAADSVGSLASTVLVLMAACVVAWHQLPFPEAAFYFYVGAVILAWATFLFFGAYVVIAVKEERAYRGAKV